MTYYLVATKPGRRAVLRVASLDGAIKSAITLNEMGYDVHISTRIVSRSETLQGLHQ